VQNRTGFAVVALIACAAWCSMVATADTVTYTYDALGRLSVVTYPKELATTYTYDAAGNRLQVQVNDTSPLSAPGVPTYTNVTQTSATANWTAATDNIPVVSYEYQVGTGSWVNVGNVLSAQLTGLAAGTGYTVSVRAKDSNGYPGPASSSTLTTLPNPPGAPGTPTFSSITTTTASMAWTAASGTVTSYSYSINNGSSWTSVGTALTASLAGLAPGTTYTALVHAANAGGTGPNSSGSFTTFITDSVTMTIGASHQQSAGFLETWRGYKSGSAPVIGSLSPTALSGGKVVTAVWDWCEARDSLSAPPPSCPYTMANTNAQSANLSVSGFTSDPGAAWLASVIAAGATRGGSDTTLIYSYASGIATWEWLAPVANGGAFGLANSGTITVSITHRP
jgi:hypothetical protein